MIEKFNLNEEELQQNYQEFIDFVSNTFSGERKDNLLNMYSTDDGCLGIALCSAPASSNEKINNVDSDGTQEALLTAGNVYTVTKLIGTAGWMLEGRTAIGAYQTAIVPD